MEKRVDSKKLIFPGIIGNILEWYDFSLYGYFAPIIAPLFFPAENKYLSLLATFGVFAIGYAMRPLGAAFFGNFGDKHGRKKTLVITISIMAFATATIGIIPTYDQIGIFAPIILILCRLTQGFITGGQFSGSIVYVVEHAPVNRRGLYGSLAIFSSYVGMLLSSSLSSLIGYMSGGDYFLDWSWRIPFILGGLLGAVGIYIRKNMPETPSFIEMKQKGEDVKNPLISSFKKGHKLILISIGITLLPAVLDYMIFTYLPSYLSIYQNVPLERALLFNSICISLVIIGLPLFGYLSDVIGRKKVFLIGCFILLFTAYPLFILIQGGNAQHIIIAGFIFAISLAMIDAVVATILVEIFPANIRLTGMSVSYNVANGIFGGTTPLVASAIIHSTSDLLSPSYYLISICLVTIMITLKVKETSKMHI